MSSFVIPSNILNDLCTRFVINLPEKESQDVIRVFFQIELAHWFYLDFYCAENSGLRQCSLKEFAFQIFNYCPSLAKFGENFDQSFESWKSYKQSVPTYGAILLDPTLQFCLLLQGYWVKSSWGFPKGKVNQDEPPVECAIREVLEETGYDIRKVINSSNYLECQFNEQICRLYIVDGIPMDTKFQAKTRQEIKAFTWFRVDYLPVHKRDNICKTHYSMNANAFFMVIPFMKDLKLRIRQMQTRRDASAELISSGSNVAFKSDKKIVVDSKSKSTSRERTVSQHRPEDDPLATSSAAFDEDNQTHGQDGDFYNFKKFDFVCPAWSNFKLDSEQLLDVMCSF